MNWKCNKYWLIQRQTKTFFGSELCAGSKIELCAGSKIWTTIAHLPHAASKRINSRFTGEKRYGVYSAWVQNTLWIHHTDVVHLVLGIIDESDMKTRMN